MIELFHIFQMVDSAPGRPWDGPEMIISGGLKMELKSRAELALKLLYILRGKVSAQPMYVQLSDPGYMKLQN